MRNAYEILIKNIKGKDYFGTFINYSITVKILLQFDIDHFSVTSQCFSAAVCILFPHQKHEYMVYLNKVLIYFIFSDTHV
jgi:hypothetical protein